VAAEFPLHEKLILITGASKRIGKAMALACAEAGADVIVHFNTSREPAKTTQREIQALGRRAWILQADLSKPVEVVQLVERASSLGSIFGLVNNAAIFSGGPFRETSIPDWEAHLAVNLTAPFLLTQAFARHVVPEAKGRVVNLLDWRALRPEPSHFAYGISKAGLAAMTRSLAQSLAPNIVVNGLALGAFLPPGDGTRDPSIVERIPAMRWGDLDELTHALLFLLAGPTYITGEIIHVDGGRHLNQEDAWTR